MGSSTAERSLLDEERPVLKPLLRWLVHLCRQRPVERPWRSFVFPKNSLCWRFPHSLGWVRTLSVLTLQLLKKGEKHQSPSGYCFAERNGVNIWLLKGGRVRNPNQRRRSIWLKVPQFFSKDDFRHSFLTICQFYFLYSISPTSAPWGSKWCAPLPGWTQPMSVFTCTHCTVLLRVRSLHLSTAFQERIFLISTL